MTLEEKVQLVHGVPFTASEVACDGYVPALERLGIPAVRMVGAGAGVTSGAATALPAPVAQAATWDEIAAYRCGAVIGLETRAKGCNVAIGGDVNIARVPLHGRTFEAYGEDPYLAGRLIVAHLRGIQAQGVAGTVKHFALNNQETKRGIFDYPPGTPAVDARADERTQREIYLPAFEAAVREARAGCVMCSYNRVDGEYASANRRLLTEILRGDWGFDGFVVSDWGAVHDTVGPMRAGLDMEMPFGVFYGKPLTEKIATGEIPVELLDEKVLRILRTLARFERSDPAPEVAVGAPEHLAVAEEVALSGAVLLRNEGLLPLDPATTYALAVIGADAAETCHVVSGGGSSHVQPVAPDDVLSALTRRFDRARVTFVRGGDRVHAGLDLPGPDTIPSSFLRAPDGSPGVLARYYRDLEFGGTLLEERVEETPAAAFNPSGYILNGGPSAAPVPVHAARSATWEAVLEPPAAGVYELELTSLDSSRLLVDGRVLIDNSGNHDVRSVSATLELEPGARPLLKVEYSPEVAVHGKVKLGWRPPAGTVDPRVHEAAGAARRSMAAVVVVRDYQAEELDRGSLRLPAGQDALIEAVAAANPRTVVVLQTGGPVLMPWAGRVGAILAAWYGGERAGSAVAKLLAGDANPGGKLPITFPRAESDLPTNTPEQFPGVDGVARYSEGLRVGYRHYDASGIEPLFCFGHGLSYTTFRYADLDVSAGAGPSVEVSFAVENTGRRAGAEVAQVYLEFPEGCGEPPQRLAGFRRVQLMPGEAARVSIRVDARGLAIWDGGWTVPGGVYRVRVGSSSRDIRLTNSAEVAPARLAPAN